MLSLDKQEDNVIVKLDHHIGSSFLTKFYRTDARFNSPLITFSQYQQLFRGVGELRTIHPPKLLFRASVDGFGEDIFHKKCDDQGKIVIIVKSNDGDLFGGYTTETLKLDSRGCQVKDEHAFTFRFDDERLYIFRLKQVLSTHALLRYRSAYLFAFGYGFWLCTNANTCTLSSSHHLTENQILLECKLPKKKIQVQNHGSSQLFDDELPYVSYTDGNEERRKYYGGFNFLVKDFEVYKIMEAATTNKRLKNENKELYFEQRKTLKKNSCILY